MLKLLSSSLLAVLFLCFEIANAAVLDPVGEASTYGGAYTANSSSPDGALLNPSGIAFSKKDQNTSSLGYSEWNYGIPSLGSKLHFQNVSSFSGMTRTFQFRNRKFTYSLILTNPLNNEIVKDFHSSQASGTEYDFHVDSSSNLAVAGAALSTLINDQLSIGFGLFGKYGLFNSSHSSRLLLSGNIVASDKQESSQAKGGVIALNLGALQKWSRLSVGISMQWEKVLVQYADLKSSLATAQFPSGAVVNKTSYSHDKYPFGTNPMKFDLGTAFDWTPTLHLISEFLFETPYVDEGSKTHHSILNAIACVSWDFLQRWSIRLALGSHFDSSVVLTQNGEENSEEKGIFYSNFLTYKTYSDTSFSLGWRKIFYRSTSDGSYVNGFSTSAVFSTEI